jgi:hypothetical protein
MSGGKLIDHQKIVGWSNNHKNNKTLAFATDSACISLSELEDFIKAAKANYPTDFTGFRIYFVRYPLPASTENIRTAGSNLSQPSLVLVPVKSFDPTKGSGEDYKVGTSEQVYALAFTDPDGSDPGDSTILCPPKCN